MQVVEDRLLIRERVQLVDAHLGGIEQRQRAPEVPLDPPQRLGRLAHVVVEEQEQVLQLETL